MKKLSRWAALGALIALVLAIQPASAQPGETAPKSSKSPAAEKKGATAAPKGDEPAAKESATGKRAKKAAKRKAPKRAKRPRKRVRRRKPKPRIPGSKPGAPNQAVRDQLTGNHPNHSTAAPRESEELKAMRALDKQLFPPAKAPASAPWSTSIALPVAGPKVDTSGVPASPQVAEPAEKPRPVDLSWLAGLKKPDFPVRYDPAVVRYLLYYKDNKRGRSMVATWLRKSGRYRGAIVKLLRQYKLPEDVLWLALVESAFNPAIHSHAGAAGLWQFMPATGRVYGLTVNRRVDERLDPERSTHAALKHLKDLYQRFGTWELAFAAYNMGYGGLLASIRKFNTNDYWELRRLEAGLPYETALYVPKIMAIAIVSRNCKVFGCDGVVYDKPAPFGDVGADKVAVAAGVTIDDVAKATGAKRTKIAELNPHVIGGRLPPLQQSALPRTAWNVYVPSGSGAQAAAKLPSSTAAKKLALHRVRWGETLPTVAAGYGTRVGYLESLNDLYPRESPRPGTSIFVPSGRTLRSVSEVAKELSLRAVVQDHDFGYTDRRRVFYDPILGDTVEDVARAAGVSAAEIRRWNHLDPRARLQEGMRIQLFIPKDAKPKDVVLFDEADVTVMTVNTPSFYKYFLDKRDRTRVEITAAEGDTWRRIGRRFGCSVGQLERVNRRSRRSKLRPGDKVVVYARRTLAERAKPPPAKPADKPSDPPKAEPKVAKPAGKPAPG